jgi:hypothetical protein
MTHGLAQRKDDSGMATLGVSLPSEAVLIADSYFQNIS